MDIIQKEENNSEKNSSCILNIENFEGPLDLLWDLIKKAKIDVTEIFISQITEQYIEYLKMLEKMNVKVASEFVSMASDLLYYKSKALLPTADMEDEYFIPPLPPGLVEKLIEYKKIQLTSVKLKECYDTFSDIYPRNNISVNVEEEDYVGASIYDLLDVFAKILEKTEEVDHKEIVFDEILVSDMIDFITSILEKKSHIYLIDLFSENPSRMEVIATIMAILEMAKYSKIKILQHKIFGDITIQRI